MRKMQRFYISISRVFPKSYRNHVNKLLVYAGRRDTRIEFFLGPSLIFGFLSIIYGIVIPYYYFPQFMLYGIIAGPMLFILLQMFTYMRIYFLADNRGREVEKALPDALQLIAANVRAGMTPFQAMKLAARDEFGALSEEIHNATTKALGTLSFGEALVDMTKRVKSTLLKRTVRLFVTSMKAGGHLASLLEETAVDIAESQSLKEDLVTNTKTYTSFITFTVLGLQPILLAIAIHFVTAITGMQSYTGGTAGLGMSGGMFGGEILITADFLIKMSVIMIVLTCILASMLMGVIAEGKEKYGLRKAPWMVFTALILFVLARYFIASMFSGMV